MLKKITYILGVSMVGFGIMLFISVSVVGAISIIAEHGLIAAFQVGGVGLLISSLFIFLGMKFVRFAESNRPENKCQVADIQSRNHITLNSDNWKRKIGEFNLSQLNLYGWLLFLSTILFILFESWVIASILKVDASKPEVKIYATISLLLGSGYFVAMKKILSNFGIRIFHDQ